MKEQDAAVEATWQAWLLERNRRGLASALWIALFLFPIFGIVDYVSAPSDVRWLLYGMRALVVLVTLLMFRVVRSRVFDRHPDVCSATYMVLVSLGLCMMTMFMGGLASAYYAGLCLTIVGTGLLYVWPLRVVVLTHASIIASFVLPNLIYNDPPEPTVAISNMFFLLSTAIIVGTGQRLTYRAQRSHIENRLLIERTTRHLAQAHAELKRLDRFKSEFFANITHELKTPLTMMLAPLELMIEGQLGSVSEAQRSTLSSIQKSGIKLRRLIGDLLDLASLEESQLRLRVEEHDLVAFVRGLVAQAEPLVLRKAIKLEFEAEVPACPVWCDLERIERVLVNLLSNATKFTPQHGKVTVSLRDEGATVLVEVADTGIGFPAELAGRIFDRFFQIDSASTRRYGGTGIGLALAKELVELHDGQLFARGQHGEGAVFSLRLPKGREHFKPDALDRRSEERERPHGSRAADHGIADWRTGEDERHRLIDIDQATEQRVVERDPDELFRPSTVLVIEDTLDVIRVIRLALHHEFRVLAATDGKKGLALARKHRPTLIITDLMMPELDGLSLTRELRSLPETQHIPVVMLTARGNLEDRLAGHDVGVNAYLVKPFSTKELLSVVRSLLVKQEATAELLMNRKLESLETIAGGLAHEIRNPLNYVKSALSNLRRDALKLASVGEEGARPSAAELDALLARMHKMFETAESGVRRITATVDLMVRYSRDGYTRSLQPYDAYAALRDIIALLEPSAGFEFSLTTELTGDGWILCVPEELNQALTNLLENAIHAIPSDGSGRVEVRAQNQGSMLIFDFQDNGSGIAPEDQPKIFTAFFTTKLERGTGLGLTIVRRVIDGLGGNIQVQSQVGVGTRFTVRLPRPERARATETKRDLLEVMQ